MQTPKKSTNISSAKATNIAHDMATRYGMVETLERCAWALLQHETLDADALRALADTAKPMDEVLAA